METRIYKKENSLSFFKLLKGSATDICKSRFLARQLAERDIKAQYRQSYLGIIWAFIMPITTAIVWIFLSSSGTVQLSDTGISYPVYVFSGTLIWSIFKEALMMPTSSTNSARGLLSKINFPKEALILSGIYKMLFNSLFKIVLLFVLMLIYKISFSFTLLLFPLGLLSLILLGVSVGLIVTPFSMLYNDVGKIINLGLSFFMYVTPVVYALPDTGLMKTIMELNPLTYVIGITRDILFGGTFTYLMPYLGVVLISLPILVLGLVWYRLSIPVIVERLSA
ncbi:ABC transporter permease [Neotamlana laminarinivorans]|uniref:Transport permease protein n=1 Tax=Neotamlana laminarinivorans TaxID=2883124 RepID=A0A9X1I277_9FLAO|nr:ABC transporter permease [Tamlana laminarinivorans]MCB4799685.1 ABC transporter permease [Tamlana laminarinivorans]